MGEELRMRIKASPLPPAGSPSNRLSLLWLEKCEDHSEKTNRIKSIYLFTKMQTCISVCFYEFDPLASPSVHSFT